VVHGSVLMMSTPAFSLRLSSRWSWTATRRWIHNPSPSKRNYHRSKNASSNATRENAIVHDAIILGGGPTGLLLSNLLSAYGIRSHLLFDKRPATELLRHPQAHFINVRSMEILKAELPRVYDGVLREMPDVSEWEGFHFGGSVMENNGRDDEDRGGGGRRLGRVIHPVREPLRVGQSGEAVLVPKTKARPIHSAEAEDGGATTRNNANNNDDSPCVSSCRPAHLAQNKFVSLLLQEASKRHSQFGDENDSKIIAENGNPSSNQHSTRLRYGEEVIRISQHKNDDQSDNHNTPTHVSVHTSSGESHRARYILAADGVHSFARNHCGISMLGDSCMQNLINVHLRTNRRLSELLMRSQRRACSDHDHDDRAMLHFVYNSKLVGAFVCHDGNEGEWVLQIPFFPPFQTMEDDFDSKTVESMIWAGLLGDDDDIHRSPRQDGADSEANDEDMDFEILSIRPWTMSSLVAQRYFDDSGNVVLVGDAAHAFPPAGGFGMNTGLQDAQNIAWRLALLLHLDGMREEDAHVSVRDKHGMPPSDDNIHPSSRSFANSLLSKYDQERRPIAVQNAALSVRNYQRTLQIAKACYLDAQHPQLLIAMLNSPPMKLLPIEVRRDMFRKLVRVAMMPLGSLCSSPTISSSRLHADHIQNNVRSILESGGSLPLVFPRYELGFWYGSDNTSRPERKCAISASGDTGGYIPKLKVGHRMPHVLVEVLTCSNSTGDDVGWAVMETLNPCQTADRNNTADVSTGRTIHMSLTDISSIVRRAHSSSSPLFTLLSVGPALPDSFTSLAEEAVMQMWSVPIMLVNVLPAKPISERPKGRKSLDTVDTHQAMLQLLHCEEDMLHNIKEQNEHRQKSVNLDAGNALILVRPDGHIANISWIEHGVGAEDMMLKQIQQVVEQGLQNALGSLALED